MMNNNLDNFQKYYRKYILIFKILQLYFTFLKFLFYSIVFFFTFFKVDISIISVNFYVTGFTIVYYDEPI